jgi:glycogen debranching enzyme
MEDLGALRIVDPDDPDRLLVAAGAPWFMTVFGRVSLLTAWMSLMIHPALAEGALRTLAQFQGTDIDDTTEEQPGRILHELRFEDAASLSLADSNVYYGSADATPLFVMLLGELLRWGLGGEVIRDLLPSADRALDWISEFGDRDGDGYLEYQRKTERGLVNQGWKDSWDGVRFADGTLPEAPIAMAEIQGYVYAAYLSRADLAIAAGDTAAANRWRSRAAELKHAFNRDFWVSEHGWFAMGLDRDKRPIDALASNMGQCLWTGIVDDDKAARVAELLVTPELFSGWGVRTLATSMRGYNPVSYHCGSVWPHDNALIAAGLMRYGFVDAAHKVVLALIDAATVQGGRLPELFSGLDRAEFPGVVSYPASCVPQAWAAASPFSLLRTLLRFDPVLNRKELHLAPALPHGVQSVVVKDMFLGDSRVSVEAARDGAAVRGLSPEIRLSA